MRLQTQEDLDLQTAQSGINLQDPDFGKKLIAVCAMVRGLTDDVDFSRDKSTTWRPLDLG